MTGWHWLVLSIAWLVDVGWFIVLAIYLITYLMPDAAWPYQFAAVMLLARLSFGGSK